MTTQPPSQGSPGSGAPAGIPGEDAASARAWSLLGNASKTVAPPGFAARVAAAAAATPQDPRPSVVLQWVRLGLPLAAAATLLFSLSGNVFFPVRDTLSPGLARQTPVDPATAQPAQPDMADVADLARMEATLALLPEDPDLADLDPALLELASVDDPARITDDQILGLVTY